MRKNLSCLMGVVLLLAAATARADDDRLSACRDLPSHAALRAQLEAARAQAERRLQPGNVGHRRQPRRDRLRGRVHRRQPRRSVARQPRDLRTESEYRERVQPSRPRALDREPLHRHPARRQSVRPSGEQPRRHRCGLRRQSGEQRSERRSDGRRHGSAASTSSAAASRSTTRSGKLVGGLGVSGDSSCADHNIAWRTRHNLNLDYVPGGVGPRRDPTGQHRLRHRAAGGPDVRHQREWMGSRRLQRDCHHDRGRSAAGEIKVVQSFGKRCPTQAS